MDVAYKKVMPVFCGMLVAREPVCEVTAVIFNITMLNEQDESPE